MSNKAVITRNAPDIDTDTVLNIYGLLSSLSPTFLRHYIKDNPTVNIRVVFRVLVAVKRLKCVTRGAIITDSNIHVYSCYRAVKHLTDIGYIKAVPRARLIIPFQRTKIDTAYSVTELGDQVLDKITSSVLKRSA